MAHGSSSDERYQTPQGFRRGLLEQLRRRAEGQQIDPQRLHRIVSFDRFLVRLNEDQRVSLLLKGGYAVELRLPGRARSTEDIDLLVADPGALTSIDLDWTHAIREVLQDAADRDLNDFFTFRIKVPRTLQGSIRFKVEVLINNVIFCTFQIDVSVGDPVVGEPQVLTSQAWLDFANLAGVSAANISALSVEQQFAEKVHALTQPRTGQNTRVQDLIDLVLLIEAGDLNEERVVRAVRAIFKSRATHRRPRTLSTPDPAWGARYERLAQECGLQANTLGDGFQRLRTYWGKLDFSRPKPAQPGSAQGKTNTTQLILPNTGC